MSISTDRPDPNSWGPVDVAVISFAGDSDVSTAVGTAMHAVSDSGSVHVVDLVALRKSADGVVSVQELVDGDMGLRVAELTDPQFDLLSDADLELIGADVDPDTVSIVVVWENTWAAEVGTAVRSSGGRMVGFERIPHDAVVAAVSALGEE